MAPTAIQQANKLNPVQMHLLHLFSKSMSEKELKELKMLLAEWYDRKAQEIMDTMWGERQLSNADMDNLLQTRPRKSSR